MTGIEPPARSVWFDMERVTEHVLAAGEPAPPWTGPGFLWVDVELSEPGDAAEIVDRGYLPAGLLEEDASAGEVAWAYDADHVRLMLAGGRLDGASLVLDRLHVVITEGVVASVHRGMPDHFDRVRSRYVDTFTSFAKSHGFLIFEMCGAAVDDLQRLVRDLAARIDELRLAVEQHRDSVEGGSELLVAVLLVRHILVRSRDLFAELSSRRSTLVPETAQPYIGHMAGRVDGLVADLAFSRDVLSEAMRAVPALEPAPAVAEAGGTAARRRRRPAPERPPLRFVSLGGFEVLRGDDPIPRKEFGRERARQVLGALLCARRPVHREELLSWFWPDLDEERGLRALRVTVSELRRALEPERRAGSDASVVRADAGAYRIELAEGDTWDVEELMSAPARASERSDPAERARLLAAALGSVRGPLYPEWPYAEWSAELRRECERASNAVRASLAESQLAAGQPEEALGHFEALLDDEPQQESWHRGIMRCYAASGERALALRQFHTCRSVFRQSQGIEPSPETQALYLDLLKQGDDST